MKLIEASHKLGGKIQTVYKDGFVIERGPDSFLERKKSAGELAKDVGLETELVNNAAGTSYVLVNEKLHSIPKGAVMGIPTQITPFIITHLFSVQGKMRAAADLVIPRSKAAKDQSLGAFFRRRLGDEVVENLIEPLLSGIYAGDIDQLSLESTFPQFYEVERKYRSLILGMKKTMPPVPKKPPNGKNKGIFQTLKGGLQSLVAAIEKKLPPFSVLKGTRVVEVSKNEGQNGYTVYLNNGERIEADSIVITVPHLCLPDLFPQQGFFAGFKDVPSTSVATVAMAFEEKNIQDHLDGTGFVVSRNSEHTITACRWTHKKWPHTTPEGKVLLRSYVGRAGEETVVDLPDEEIEQIVLDDLKSIMKLSAKPEFTVITRWKHAMPQYTVGHKGRIERMKENVGRELPGIFIAGSSFEGLGIPDCIDQGKEVVEQVLHYIHASF
jgi:oxygen-dependent protoporphyrinogen oxidase